MTDYIYVDNSNIYIEGCRLAAVKNFIEENIYEAMNNRTLDNSWQLDYGKLYQFFCSDGAIAKLWGSPPPSDSFWQMVARKGWEVKTFRRNVQNREKEVDMAIGHAMTKDAYKYGCAEHDTFTLVAGDRDYAPVVSDLVSEGFRVDVAFWSHASSDLKQAATRFIDLDQYHGLISK
jgi:uncharacterized LabA/DUF88 family protein